MIDLDAYSVFADYKASLKETSEDKQNKQYMMPEAEESVVHFENATKAFVKNRGIVIPKNEPQPLKAVDALMVKDGLILFVEFKNGKNIDPRDLRDKIRHSILTFLAVTSLTMADLQASAVMIVVYNPDAVKSETKLSAAVARNAGECIFSRGLGYIQRMFLREVRAYTPKEFEEYLASK